MGVRGLFGYIERHCPEALEDVNLHRLGDEYRRRHRTRPVLVLDCNNFLSAIYGNLEFALGGQWSQYFEKLKTFLAAFRSAGFELVIIFDGFIEKKKLNTWIDRRKKERKLVAKIFGHIKHIGEHPPHNLFHIPPSLSSFTRLALKSLGASVHNSSMELDRECYLYCKQHSCYGVVSRDTDMMIYDFPGVFLMTYGDGNIKRMQWFRKDILCRHLGLNPQLLPLLACLVGCDSMKPTMLFRFHDMVTRGKRDPVIPSVAGFIRSLQVRDLSRRSMDWVAGQVNEYLGNGFLYECVQEYACDPQEQVHGHDPSRIRGIPGSSVPDTAVAPSPASYACDVDPAVLKKIESCHRDLSITDTVMQCVTIRQHYSNMALEDDADESMPSSALLYRPVRQRMYGLLSSRKSSATGSTSTVRHHQAAFGVVEEICVYAGNPLNAPDVVQGLPLDMAPQLRLEDLWVDSPGVQRLRTWVFFSCLSSTPLLEAGILDAIPQHHILLCCLLHYLLLSAPASTLRHCDVDAFLSQAVCLQGHSPVSLGQLHVHYVNPRAVHLATIFVRGLKTGCDLNSTCCLPFRMDSLLPWHSFDGKLFHLKYLAAEGGQSVVQLCEHRAEALESFYEMRRWIVMGTRLQE